jgi:hypothetical protein
MKIVKPNVPYSHEYGDFIYEGSYSSEILGSFPKSALNKDRLFLSYIGVNTWTALQSLGVENAVAIQALFDYDCPYTGITYNAVSPIAILTDDVKKYLNPKLWYFDIALDQEWNKRYKLDNDSAGSVMFHALGPGYTDCCGVNDGDSSVDCSTLTLDNGDLIFCNNRVWHNK